MAACVQAAEEEYSHGRSGSENARTSRLQSGFTDLWQWIARSDAQHSRIFHGGVEGEKTATRLRDQEGIRGHDKVEHIWISSVTYDGKNFHGKINNRPLDVKNVHLSRMVTVAPGKFPIGCF